MRPPPISDGVLMSSGSASPCSSGVATGARRGESSDVSRLPAANQAAVEISRKPPVDEA